MTLHPNPPSVDADFEVSGCYDPKTLIGPQGLILRAIAKSYKFTWRILASEYVSVNPSDNLARALVVNRNCKVFSNFMTLKLAIADIIGNFGHMPYLSGGAQDSILKLLKVAHTRLIDPLVVVVPIIPGNPMNISEDFLVLLGFAIVIIVILRITVRVIKLNNKFWTTENIFRAIFGIDVTDNTIKISERILLGCLFIISFFYSADIIDAIFDAIEINSNRKSVNNLEQLDEAGITLMINKHYAQLLRLSEDPLVKRLAENAKSSSFTKNYECVNELVLKHRKNVSCIMSLSTAKNGVRFSTRIHGEPNIFILKDYVLMQWLMIYMSPLAVYDKAFQKMVQNLDEGGLIEQWYRTELMKTSDESMTKSLSSMGRNRHDETILSILIKLGIGYILSIFLLLGEIIVHRYAHVFRG
ncbi:uncharacterized protein LOC116416938 [Nasonia vitripennis]|uniref:Uncharacterized protein n=1 Tax=Nasonia vitripennis TaxID=7425 RepID=A0A7M7QV39_NASVI|nr:uncharacterized protein LOC116416938 [Nasonia vitripennis]XP_032454064.1 uncharacterized protein LOC116416938 [Nasonia vitripennis]XP_032454065.1 uncharacterized protein LOC116416938 [Nasonia vitripennis]